MTHPSVTRTFRLRITACLLLAISLLAQNGRSEPLHVDFSRLDESHDIPDLPAWGPYSKRYAGISHIPDLKQGLRFDFTVLPGFYRFKTLIPNVRWASYEYPWAANASLTRLTYR